MLGLKQWMIHYCHDVINNKIIACQKHIWACIRFLRDVDREGTDAFPFVFDEDKALRFFEWMHLFRHTKGVLRGQRIEPHEIQVFIFGNIYGWVHKETGYRRFRNAYWQVGRKNAKSQSLAVVASYEAMALGENMSEVYIGATKTEQARIVWNETEAMLKGAKELQGKYKVAYNRIFHEKSGSVIRALSKEDRKTGDGLSPQAAIIDEYHAHETSEIYDVLDSGMIARAQPLMMIITTAGTNLSSPCYRTAYKYVSDLLNPNNPTENESYFSMVNELDRDTDGELIDDITDEKSWLKANPIAASYPEGVTNIRSRLQIALEIPEKMDEFLTKNMNIWVNQKEKAYMRMEKWTACNGEMIDLQGRECYVGVDLSAKIDLTSVGFVFPLDDGSIAIKSHSFMPRSTIEAKTKTDKVPYHSWERQGWITATPGEVIDQRFIQDYIKKEIEKNGWIAKELCYDAWNASQFANEMADEGFITVEIIQGIKTLSEPTKNFRELVYRKKVLHENNPVFDWALGNAVTREDHNQNIMLDKSKSTQRIDPVAAMINAHVRAMFSVENSVDVSEFAKEDFLAKLWG